MLKKYLFPIVIGVVGVLLLWGWINNIPEKSLKSCFPMISYKTQKSVLGEWVSDKTEKAFPNLRYMEKHQIVARREDYFIINKMKPVELLTMMEFENVDNMEQQKVIEEPEITKPQIVIPSEESVPVVQTGIIRKQAEAFVPHTLQEIVDIQKLSEFDTLLNEFYIVDSVAMVNSEMMNAQKLNSLDLRISKEAEGPQILIYHTHSQEGFIDSVPGDDSTTIIGVGEHLAEILRNQYGYEVLHHQGKYDVETRDDAYSRSLPEIKKILEENPSIQVVVDLHRDAVADINNKLVMDLDGRPTARFMFFNGVSCGKKTGNIEYLKNPHLDENLAFSFQLKKVAEEYYPGLTRKNYINAYRYNMHLCGRTTLLELGAQNNTVEEAMNACDPIAHILDMVLSGA